METTNTLTKGSKVKISTNCNHPFARGKIGTLVSIGKKEAVVCVEDYVEEFDLKFRIPICYITKA